MIEDDDFNHISLIVYSFILIISVIMIITILMLIKTVILRREGWRNQSLDQKPMYVMVDT